MSYREQLSLMSRGKSRECRVHIAPRWVMLEDGVEDGEQFAHTSYQGHLFGLPAATGL